MKTQAERLPGEPGIWVFVGGDLVIFGLFFLTYMTYRMQDLPLYRHGEATMNQGLGVANTLFLLTSSWFVASAVQRMRAGDRATASRLIALALACGSGFVVVKAIEWSTKIAAGTTLLTDDYFMFYFMFTGIHLVHVLIGMGILTMLFAMARRRAGAPIALFEAGAIFWHMVDLLWVVLFALFYLI